MFNHLEIMIKLRCAELLAEAKNAQMLKITKRDVLSRASQLQRSAEDKDAPNLNYTITAGQGEAVLKTPHTDQLLKAAKSESQDTDDLGEVIFFKKSVF
jgi:hypothetical protein